MLDSILLLGLAAIVLLLILLITALVFRMVDSQARSARLILILIFVYAATSHVFEVLGI